MLLFIEGRLAYFIKFIQFESFCIAPRCTRNQWSEATFQIKVGPDKHINKVPEGGEL